MENATTIFVDVNTLSFVVINLCPELFSLRDWRNLSLTCKAISGKDTINKKLAKFSGVKKSCGKPITRAGLIDVYLYYYGSQIETRYFQSPWYKGLHLVGKEKVVINGSPVLLWLIDVGSELCARPPLVLEEYFELSKDEMIWDLDLVKWMNRIEFLKQSNNPNSLLWLNIIIKYLMIYSSKYITIEDMIEICADKPEAEEMILNVWKKHIDDFEAFFHMSDQDSVIEKLSEIYVQLNEPNTPKKLKAHLQNGILERTDLLDLDQDFLECVVERKRKKKQKLNQ